MTEHSEGSEDSSQGRDKYVAQAVRMIDPNGWVRDEIDHFRARSELIDVGMRTEYDPVSYDNDHTYTDPEMIELHRQLEEQFDTAIGAISALHRSQDAIRARIQQMRDDQWKGEMTQRKARTSMESDAAALAGTEELTVEDILGKKNGEGEKSDE